MKTLTRLYFNARNLPSDGITVLDVLERAADEYARITYDRVDAQHPAKSEGKHSLLDVALSHGLDLSQVDYDMGEGCSIMFVEDSRKPWDEQNALAGASGESKRDWASTCMTPNALLRYHYLPQDNDGAECFLDVQSDDAYESLAMDAAHVEHMRLIAERLSSGLGVAVYLIEADVEGGERYWLPAA